jgi:hypothetical protein
LNKYNIDQYNINYGSEEKINFDDNDHKLLISVFRTTKTKILTKNDLLKRHKAILTNIIGGLIDSKQFNNGKKKERIYELNKGFMNINIELIKYRNPDFKNFDDRCINQLNNILNNKIIKQNTSDNEKYKHLDKDIFFD